jgi:hypothetical protein
MNESFTSSDVMNESFMTCGWRLAGAGGRGCWLTLS